MKTEDEIRRHRDNLKTCIDAPCGCAGTRHELQCFIGMKMMKSTIDTLSWILGENADEDMERLVAEMNHDAAQIRGSQWK